MAIGNTGNVKRIVIESCHSKCMAGHMGIDKTKSCILESVIWYHLGSTREEHVNGDAVCTRKKEEYRG